MTALMQYLGLLLLVVIGGVAAWILLARGLDLAARSDAELQRRTQDRARTAGDVRGVVGVEDPTGGEES